VFLKPLTCKPGLGVLLFLCRQHVAHRRAGSKSASLLFLLPAKEQRQESRMIKCTSEATREEQLADTLHELQYTT
jgi:hypothetical protein